MAAEAERSQHQLRSFCTRGLADRINNLAIAGATADVSAEPIADRLVIGVGMTREQSNDGQDHPGGTEATLERACCEEGGLDAVQYAIEAEALDRHDRAAIDRERKRRTRSRR